MNFALRVMKARNYETTIMRTSLEESELNPRRFFEQCLVRVELEIPALSITYISKLLESPLHTVVTYVNFVEDDVIRKAESGDLLSIHESKLLLGLLDILKEVEFISDLPSEFKIFNFGRWLGDWVRIAVPALNGATPSNYLSTLEGQTIIKNLLGCAVSGAYR